MDWPEWIRAREHWWVLAGAGVTCILAFVILWVVGLPDVAAVVALDVGSDGQPIAPVVGAVAPSFSVQTTDGDTLTLADLRGSPVILNFWATWCGPCQVELPDLQRLYEERQNTGLRVVGINVDEAPAVFGPWAAARGLTFVMVADVGAEIQALFHVRGTPQTIIIDADGVIQAVFYGPLTFNRLERVLDDLVMKQNQP
ncbi:peroxiredoxin family protein [Chloroflexota bacterium]